MRFEGRRLGRPAFPGAVIAIQTFGGLLGFNPHGHILITDGFFYGKGMFRAAPPLELKKLEAIFRHKVFCIHDCRAAPRKFAGRGLYDKSLRHGRAACGCEDQLGIQVDPLNHPIDTLDLDGRIAGP